MVEFHGFCLSIVYIARQHHSYIESHRLSDRTFGFFHSPQTHTCTITCPPPYLSQTDRQTDREADTHAYMLEVSQTIISGLPPHTYERMTVKLEAIINTNVTHSIWTFVRWWGRSFFFKRTPSLLPDSRDLGAITEEIS